VKADHGSYFVTIYKTTRLHDGRERKKEIEEKNENN